MKLICFVIFVNLFFLTFQARSQSLGISQTFENISTIKGNGFDYVLQLVRYDSLNQKYFFSIKKFDSSDEAAMASYDININGTIILGRQNNIVITSIDDSRVDSITAIFKDDKLLFTVLRKNNRYVNKRDMFSSREIKSVNRFDTLFSKKMELSDRKNVTELFKMDNDNLKVFNLKESSQGNIVFSSFPDSSFQKKIRFDKNEHIVVVNEMHFFPYGKGVSYFLVYLKPKSRITEGKYEEYYEHLWIPSKLLYKHFKYQK